MLKINKQNKNLLMSRLEMLHGKGFLKPQGRDVQWLLKTSEEEIMSKDKLDLLVTI